MANVTYHCAATGCGCKVADDETHCKTAAGLFCCQGCADGNGCSHTGCDCASKAESQGW